MCQKGRNQVSSLTSPWGASGTILKCNSSREWWTTIKCIKAAILLGQCIALWRWRHWCFFSWWTLRDSFSDNNNIQTTNCDKSYDCDEKWRKPRIVFCWKWVWVSSLLSSLSVSSWSSSPYSVLGMRSKHELSEWDLSLQAKHLIQSVEIIMAISITFFINIIIIIISKIVQYQLYQQELLTGPDDVGSSWCIPSPLQPLHS